MECPSSRSLHTFIITQEVGNIKTTLKGRCFLYKLMKDNWEQMAMGQAEIIDGLSFLCRDLIDELAQFCNVDEEEKRLAELEAR